MHSFKAAKIRRKLLRNQSIFIKLLRWFGYTFYMLFLKIENSNNFYTKCKNSYTYGRYLLYVIKKMLSKFIKFQIVKIL